MTRHCGIVRVLKSFRHSDAGGAMIELAVVLPLLVLLAVGVAEFGRLYFTSITIANAARAGAQYGAQSTAHSSDNAGIIAAVQSDAADITPINTPTVTEFCGCPDGTAVACTGTCTGYGLPQLYIQVTASKTVSHIMKYPNMPASTTISRTATFRVH